MSQPYRIPTYAGRNYTFLPQCSFDERERRIDEYFRFFDETIELFKNSIDLEFFQKHTYKEVIKLRNARVKRYEKDREREEARRKEEAARQQQMPGKLRRS